jgi:hypothetical protein
VEGLSWVLEGILLTWVPVVVSGPVLMGLGLGLELELELGLELVEEH